tara:strand:- start:7438 stop:7644 length:207 start_codon:yes stop_codon:yes gene_type:complete
MNNILLGCAVCFGAPDHPMTIGMQWGIVSLLLMLVLVLSWFIGLSLFFNRRAKEYKPFQDPELFLDKN